MNRRFFSVALASFLITSTSMTLPASADHESQIGGRFLLKDQTGKLVTDQDFAGKFMLIYFGYTYCPDICPTSLQTITNALEVLGDEGDIIQPIFITIDPERDTVAVMREYVKNFHPRLIGLTGSEVSIASVAKKYRVRFAKVAEAGASKDDYLVDHTASVFLMGPDGKFLTRFSHNTTFNKMAKKLRKYITKVENK